MFSRSVAQISKLLSKTSSANQLAVSVRWLNLQEHQSKKLLGDYGVNVQRFFVCDSDKDAQNKLTEFHAREYVIKSQILAGGRGKGTFDNGFQGGVRLSQQKEEVVDFVKHMVGHKLVTKQTPPEGVMVEKMPVDIHQGLTHDMAMELAKDLKFEGKLQESAAEQIQKLYELFLKVDTVQIEINPFAETGCKRVFCIDAKLTFDDSAEYRQKHIFDLDEHSEQDPREYEAEKHKLSYIGMDGNIACLVNGAGLAMATMDIIKLHGGEPANFLDVGGNVQEDQVIEAFKIITSDKRVKAILVNIFGGIVNCATIARGLTNAFRKMHLTVPLVVRLEGTNVDEARQILQDSKLPIVTAGDLGDAAQKAVKSLG